MHRGVQETHCKCLLSCFVLGRDMSFFTKPCSCGSNAVKYNLQQSQDFLGMEVELKVPYCTDCEEERLGKNTKNTIFIRTVDVALAVGLLGTALYSIGTSL